MLFYLIKLNDTMVTFIKNIQKSVFLWKFKVESRKLFRVQQFHGTAAKGAPAILLLQTVINRGYPWPISWELYQCWKYTSAKNMLKKLFSNRTMNAIKRKREITYQLAHFYAICLFVQKCYSFKTIGRKNFKPWTLEQSYRVLTISEQKPNDQNSLRACDCNLKLL